MAVVKLDRREVPKVWGRADLPAMFARRSASREPIGEIWFEHPAGRDAELLVKYLFTSAKLSVQVHPDDEAARRAGHERGKEEAWLVLDADPGAVIGVGLTRPVGKEELRRAALDGSIETMLDWRPAAAGDVYSLKAGTVHALGAGLVIVEVQQKVDLTYRLYDYGRPRELHLDEAIAVANPAPCGPAVSPCRRDDGREILVAGGAFVLERWCRPLSASLQASGDRPVWLAMIGGQARVEDWTLEPGTVWLVDAEARLDLDPESQILAAYPGGDVEEHLLA